MLIYASIPTLTTAILLGGLAPLRPQAPQTVQAPRAVQAPPAAQASRTVQAPRTAPASRADHVSRADREPQVEYRLWQFHELDVPYVKKAMERASDYDINTVVLSHEMIEKVSQLYDGTDRAEKLRGLAEAAGALGLDAWIWIHELEDVPARFREARQVQMDREGFWDWLAGRYEKLFTDFPQFDGIILTFQETEYKIFSDVEVASSLSKPERFTKLINTIDEVCRKYGKDFVVRSFLYEPQQMEWFSQGLEDVHPRVMLQSKAVPHDWQPYYPHNAMIGRFPDRKLIVEFDASSEFTGKNRIPWTSPEYFAYRWKYGLSQPGVVGYNARLDHGGYDALFTPNEINLYTLYRLTQDPTLTPDSIWREWTVKRYGEEAARWVERALRPTFDAVNKSFFALEFWITDHSKLPDFGYANAHISGRTIAKWKPDEPRYRELERRLNHPDPVILERILAEKDTAIALAEEALIALQKAKPYLTPEQYEDLSWRLDLLHRTAIVWKLHAEAFFGYKVLAEGHEVPGLRARVNRAIQALYRQAEVSELNPRIPSFDPEADDDPVPPATPEKIRLVAEQIELRLNMPDAVRTTIQREFPDTPVEGVERVQRENGVIYTAEAEPSVAPEIEVMLLIAEDGTLLERRESSYLQYLPQAIVDAYRRIVDPAQVTDLDIWKSMSTEGIRYDIAAETAAVVYTLEISDSGELLERQTRPRAADEG